MAEGTPDPELLDRLRESVASVSGGQTVPLVDRELEERLAPLAKKAARLINHRERSVAELRRRLTESLVEGEDSRLVDTVIERCLRNGMLDDERFATEWVRQRHRNQRKSVVVLRRELQDKGVSQGTIESALSQISEEDQWGILQDLVRRKAGTVSRVPADRSEYEKALRRILGVAARRGFPQGASLSAAREALEERISELDG